MDFSSTISLSKKVINTLQRFLLIIIIILVILVKF